MSGKNSIKGVENFWWFREPVSKIIFRPFRRRLACNGFKTPQNIPDILRRFSAVSAQTASETPWKLFLRRVLVPAFILAGFFIFVGNAKAAEHLDQYKGNTYRWVIANHAIEQSFVPQQNNISRFVVYNVYNSTMNYLTADVVFLLCADYSCDNILAQQHLAAVNANNLVFQPEMPISLISGNTYWLKIYSSEAFQTYGGNKNDGIGNFSQSSELYIDDVYNWWSYGHADILIFDEYYNDCYAPQPARNPVIIVPGFFGSWDVGGKLALDPILHTYDNLWEALKLAGYEQDKTLFAFPYNWRQSNATSSQLLKQKIADVKAVCNSAKPDGYNCDKVDLVTHSMGGLVARAYIESDNYQNDVDQLVFLATPQQGAPMAYLAWEGGNSGTKLEDSIMWNIMFSEAQSKGYFTNFLYFRGLPMLSLKELLPTFNYLRDKGLDSLRNYPDNYPQNDFLENLNNPLNLAKLNNVKILNIVVDDNIGDTINAFRVVPRNSSIGMWEYGYPENYSIPFTDHGVENGPGDNTVPAISNKDFNNFDQNIFINSNHLTIVSDAQSAVIKELTGSSPSQEVRKNFIKKFFMARIFSPADFLITAPDGKKVGKDFSSGQAINEIDGAYYSGKFATIPDPLDGEYRIELQGTGNGEYKLSISGINDATSTDKDFSGQITIGAIQDFKIDYSSSGPDLVGDLQPQDIVPPSLTINSPLAGGNYKHSDKMMIDYQSSDDFSGVASAEIKIDDKFISSTTVDLFDYQIGTHTLSILVYDEAGNTTEKKVAFSITADIKSAIADIEEIYKRSWLKSSSRKNILIGELKILDGALNLFDKAKNEISEKIEETENNTKLSVKAKEKFIAELNKELIKLVKNREKIIKLDLAIFEKTLNKAEKSNYLNQTGYDIIKNNLEYLENNL